MKTRLLHLLLAPLLVFTASSAWALDQTVHQQYDAPAGGKLIVDVDFSTIEVVAGTDGKVAVEADRKIDARDEAREKEYFAATPLTVTQEGNTVTERARPPEGKCPERNWSGNVTMDARYQVQVPPTFNADLRTSGGSISLEACAGDLNVNASGGAINALRSSGCLR